MSFIKDFARPSQSAYYVLQDRMIRAFGRRTAKSVRERQLGRDPVWASDKAAVYVHFDPEGVVHDYVVHQLRELALCGFRITFVTNSPSFPATSRSRIFPYCREFLWRHNAGYDFGAYKDGLAAIENAESLAALVLMNDSIYGPFWSLSETLARFEKLPADFWGIVDSWENRYHLQSFFVLFSAKVLKHSAFRIFWRDLPYINNKGWVVRNAEVELSQALTRNGLRAAALVSYWEIAQVLKDRLPSLTNDFLEPASSVNRSRNILLTGRASNPMHFFWETLIRDFKCPFIKRDLIRTNPAKIDSVYRWPEVISAVSRYDIAMITRHLEDGRRQ